MTIKHQCGLARTEDSILHSGTFDQANIEDLVPCSRMFNQGYMCFEDQRLRSSTYDQACIEDLLPCSCIFNQECIEDQSLWSCKFD